MLERQIEILKLLHGRKMRTGQLAEYFNVDDRTIRSDIDRLRSGLDFFGTKIKIDSKHEGSQHHYYTSTVHPVFLSLNLSELFMLLNVLENKLNEPGGEVYRNIFRSIYGQMTDYAENIIAPKLAGQYDKKEVINLLEEEAFEHKDYKLVFWSKSGRYIEISYVINNKIVRETARLVQIRNNEIKIRNKEGDEKWINYGIEYNRVCNFKRRKSHRTPLQYLLGKTN